MKSVDVLYYSLAICSFLAVAILWYVAYYLVKTLREATKIAEDVSDITQDVDETKNFLKKHILLGAVGIFDSLSRLLSHEQRAKTSRNRTRYSKV